MEGVLTDGMFVGVLVGGMVCLKQLVLQSGLGVEGADAHWASRLRRACVGHVSWRVEFFGRTLF